MAVINENFDGPDKAGLGYQLTWTKVLGDFTNTNNKADSNGGGRNTARAESDLATADHYVQAVISNLAPNLTIGGVCVRFNPTAETYYWGRLFTTDNVAAIHKVVAGVLTQIASTPFTIGASHLVRLEVEGSDLRFIVDGSPVLATTDTDITGFTRTGIATSNAFSNLDDFEAGDLAAPQNIPLGQAAEVETGQPITPLLDRQVTVGQTTEAETANLIQAVISRDLAVGQATESELARPITPVIGRMVPIGQATETETAGTITPSRAVAVGRASEVELARLISPIKPILVPVQTAVERELARIVTPTKVVPGQLGPAVCEVVSPSAECETFAL